MRISSIGYTIKQGFSNIWRNKMFSLASMATMSACIFLFGLFFAIVTNFEAMVKEAESGMAVTVLFDEGITQEQIDAIGQEIKKRVEVSEYEFISPEQAWEEFKGDYFGDNAEAAAGFADDNPLANSASYAIYMNDISMQPVLVDFLEGLDGVREVRHSEVAGRTLTDFNSLIGYISVGIILILLLVAVFLISNTVTTGIAVRKDEIGIMKLIGATDYFVRAPFVVEGVLIGLIGSVVPLALLYFLYRKVVFYISDKFSFLSSLLNFLPAQKVFHTLVPVGLVLGVGIGFLGSWITIRKHLKV
ncbi:MAG: ABC transporter permease [Lachnospiraceae bacterium]|uniref:permease-like cell division protein FtsX n=1 Tax=Roseburia sp. 1XD42-69 TaxID=2320088 RepID=UPI000EA1BF19|nr:permease-like cell division protein FtsX [Roseburia sp. 1XD42-69]MCI8875142.1 ABC transporter permease [Lachnospiraceae bacterium]MCX4319765.1 permease-like cell division protein FtsX [Lachnospiraceae bacterium]RKJ64177.1 ABC transporter permease [Roseburia sp. 1XD42-69]